MDGLAWSVWAVMDSLSVPTIYTDPYFFVVQQMAHVLLGLLLMSGVAYPLCFRFYYSEIWALAAVLMSIAWVEAVHLINGGSIIDSVTDTIFVILGALFIFFEPLHRPLFLIVLLLSGTVAVTFI